MTARAVWCLGMYASASTWLFNVVRQILEVSQMESVGVTFVSGKENGNIFGDTRGIGIIKSHEISSDARISEVSKKSRKIFITIRDPRDAVTSLIQSHGYDFDHSLDLIEKSASLCRSFSKDKRAILFRYETGFSVKPSSIMAIAEHLGYKLEESVVQTIFTSLTRAEVEKHIRQLPTMSGILKDNISGDLLDTKTQWHTHHAGRDGKIGKWERFLNATQVDLIERRVSFYSGMPQER